MDTSPPLMGAQCAQDSEKADDVWRRLDDYFAAEKWRKLVLEYARKNRIDASEVDPEQAFQRIIEKVPGTAGKPSKTELSQHEKQVPFRGLLYVEPPQRGRGRPSKAEQRSNYMNTVAPVIERMQLELIDQQKAATVADAIFEILKVAGRGKSDWRRRRLAEKLSKRHASIKFTLKNS